MSFWGKERWIEANLVSSLLDDFDPSRLDHGGYKLSAGDEAIVSSDKNSKKGALRILSEKKPLLIEPESFAYLITKEVVHIPNNALGFINVGTQTKLKGLVNISGFHAGPNYSGKLLFTVFNAGPSVIAISFLEPIFRLWLSDFSPPTTDDKIIGYPRIPREYIESLHFQYPSPFVLAEKIVKLEAQVKAIGQRRFTNVITILIISLLLAPFAAAMYSEVFGDFYKENFKEWIEKPFKRVDPKTSSQQSSNRSTLPGSFSSSSSHPTPAPHD